MHRAFFFSGYVRKNTLHQIDFQRVQFSVNFDDYIYFIHVLVTTIMKQAFRGPDSLYFLKKRFRMLRIRDLVGPHQSTVPLTHPDTFTTEDYHSQCGCFPV